MSKSRQDRISIIAVAGNGLLDRRALLGRGIMVAGAMGAGAAGALTGAAAAFATAAGAPVAVDTVRFIAASGLRSPDDRW